MPRDERLDRLRVTNQQRDNAVRSLRQAVADGRLAFDEFDARMPVALGSVTRGDLVRVLEDLVEPSELDQVIADPQSMGDGPGFSWEHPLVIGPDRGDNERIGPWDVPPFLELNSGMWGIRLDFQMARAVAPAVDIVVTGSMMSSIQIIVPDGWGVDTSGVNTNGQAQISSPVRTRPSPGNPRLILSGQMSGTLAVRRAGKRDQRRLARHLRKNPPALGTGAQ